MLEKNSSVSSLNLNLQPRASSLERPVLFGADKMLSVEEDFRKPTNERDDPPDAPHQQLLRIENEDAEYLVDLLGLDEVRQSERQSDNAERKPKPTEDTKNILRNFGNAHTQYILYNARPILKAQSRVKDLGRFHKWVRRLRLENFQQFKHVWLGEAGCSVYSRLYRELCWDFYAEEAVGYVLSSRMKNELTKNTHLKYVYRFLEGIVTPSDFYYFKKQ